MFMFWSLLQAVGSRIGGDTRKQYLELGDRPILVQTLSRLADHPQITAIHLVVPASGCRLLSR